MGMTTSLLIKLSRFQDETLNDTTKMILNLSLSQNLIKMMALNPKVKNEITLRRVLESLEIISERLKLSTNKTNSLKMKSLDRQVIRILLYETKKQHIKTISLIRFLKVCLHLWKWRNSNQESTHRSTLQISFRPKTSISALDQQRQITEIERIKINEILEDLIIQDFQLIHHSFQKH